MGNFISTYSSGVTPKTMLDGDDRDFKEGNMNLDLNCGFLLSWKVKDEVF